MSRVRLSLAFCCRAVRARRDGWMATSTPTTAPGATHLLGPRSTTDPWVHAVKRRTDFFIIYISPRGRSRTDLIHSLFFLPCRQDDRVCDVCAVLEAHRDHIGPGRATLQDSEPAARGCEPSQLPSQLHSPFQPPTLGVTHNRPFTPGKGGRVPPHPPPEKRSCTSMICSLFFVCFSPRLLVFDVRFGLTSWSPRCPGDRDRHRGDQDLFLFF